MNRRKVIVGTGVAVSAVLAGCTDETSDDPEPEENTGNESEDNTPEPGPEPAEASIEQVQFSVGQNDSTVTFDAGTTVSVDVDYTVGIHEGKYESTVGLVVGNPENPIVDTGVDDAEYPDGSEAYSDTETLEFETEGWEFGAYDATVTVEDVLGETGAEETFELEVTDPIAKNRKEFNEYLDAAQSYIQDAIDEFDGDSITDGGVTSSFDRTAIRNAARPAYDELGAASTFLEEEDLGSPFQTRLNQVEAELEFVRETAVAQNYLTQAIVYLDEAISAADDGLSVRMQNRMEDSQGERSAASDVLDELEDYYSTMSENGDSDDLVSNSYDEKLTQLEDMKGLLAEYDSVFETMAEGVSALDEAENSYQSGNYLTAITQTDSAERSFETAIESAEAIENTSHFEDRANELVDLLNELIERCEDLRSNAASAQDEGTSE